MGYENDVLDCCGGQYWVRKDHVYLKIGSGDERNDSSVGGASK